MKKTLLSVIAGLAVVGSANAVPSVEDLRDMCLKNPSKYVWSEKAQDCIRINPCADSEYSSQKRLYCVETEFSVPSTDDAIVDSLVKRYVEKVLETSVSKSSELINFTGKADSFLYRAVHTTDGGYYVIKFDGVGGDVQENLVKTICWAYGKPYDDEKMQCLNTNSKSECEDLKDFARLIYEPKVVSNVMSSWDEPNKSCWLVHTHSSSKATKYMAF